MNISADLNDPLVDRFPDISSVFGAAFNLLIGIGWGLFFVFLSITLIKIIMSAGDKFKFKAAMDSLRNIAIGFLILLIFSTFLYIIPTVFTGNPNVGGGGGIVVPPGVGPGPPPVPPAPPGPSPGDPDNDGDGWPVSWDCDDTDALVHPLAATDPPSPYYQDASNGGTFDYDCNGEEEKHPRFNCSGTVDYTCRASPPTNFQNGWAGAIPNCGDVLSDATSYMWILCNGFAISTCVGTTTTDIPIDCNAGCVSASDTCLGTPGPPPATPDGPCLAWNVAPQIAWPGETTPWTRMPCR